MRPLRESGSSQLAGIERVCRQNGVSASTGAVSAGQSCCPLAAS